MNKYLHPPIELSTWAFIQQKVFNDIPSFFDLWNPNIESSMKDNPLSVDYLDTLNRYLEELNAICAQMIFTVECIKNLPTQQWMDTARFYVGYHFYNFIVRVKTGTDLLALLINKLYRLNIKNNQCSLARGPLIHKLRTSFFASKNKDDLANEIDRARHGWLVTFDDLRDAVIHRSGVSFVGMPNPDYLMHIQIPHPIKKFTHSVPVSQNQPMGAGKELENNNPLYEYLKISKTASASSSFSCNPVILCEEIWEAFTKTTNNILELCKDDLLGFYDSKKNE
jgi:hypothetical protein